MVKNQGCTPTVVLKLRVKKLYGVINIENVIRGWFMVHARLKTVMCCNLSWVKNCRMWAVNVIKH